MIDWIANKLGYVHRSAFESSIVYYTGRLRSQKAVIDTQQDILYNNRRKIEDLEETVEILRCNYNA
jgi:hypothetical protein